MARLGMSMKLRPSVKPRPVPAPVRKSAKVARKPRREAEPVGAGVPTIKEKLSRSQLIETLRASAEEAMDREYSKKEALAFLTAYEHAMIGSIKKGGCGEFVHSGFFKVKLKEVPRKIRKAIKKGELVLNPRTGEKTPHPTGREKQIIPATVKPKLLPQKKLKLAVLGQ